MVLHLYNGQAGIALHGQAEAGPAVVGTNHAQDRAATEGSNTVGCGVLGFSGPARPTSVPKSTGVYGRSEAPKGFGVIGEATNTATEVYGVEGLVSGGQGRGVFGWSLAESSGGTGVWGQADSPDGVGVKGYAWDGFGGSNKFGTGVMGFSGSSALPPTGTAEHRRLRDRREGPRRRLPGWQGPGSARAVDCGQPPRQRVRR